MKKCIIFLIRIYQVCFSGLFIPSCRYHPSCSDYAICAIERKGIIVGTLLSLWRVCRCNPLLPGGYDPVK